MEKTISQYMSEIGSKGGKVKSKAKSDAARANQKKAAEARRKKKIC